MPDQPQFEVKIEAERNLLRTRFAGHITASAMQRAAAQVQAAVPGLKPGFTALTDFSRVVAMDLDTVPHLTHIMDTCRAHGIGRIIRVLPEPDKDIGINLLSLVHYRGVQKLTADSVAAAERALA